MGAGTYTRQYFARDTRYDVLQCSSRGHNLPIVDGGYQKFGVEYSARDVKYENGVFSADIAPAYGNPELRSLVRSFRWTDDTVILKDTYVYEGEGELVERFVSLNEPTSDKAGTVNIDGVTLTYDPEKYELSFGSEPRTANGAMAYFTDLKLKKGVTEFTATFTV